MDRLDPFSCQLHHIAFDRLKSHTPSPFPATQSINIPLKFHCVFFIIYFTIANSHQRKVLFQTQYLMRCHLCIENNKGPRTVPWGTPDKTGAQSEFTPFTTTRCRLKHRKESIYFNVLAPIPKLNNLLLRSSWGSYQMPFQNLIWMCQPVLYILLLSKILAQSFITLVNGVSQLWRMHVAYLTGLYIHQGEPWYLNVLCVRVTCKVHKSRKPGDNCTQVICHSSWKGGKYWVLWDFTGVNWLLKQMSKYWT